MPPAELVRQTFLIVILVAGLDIGVAYLFATVRASGSEKLHDN